MVKAKWDKLIKQLEDANKDPEFVRAADEFIMLTTGQKKV